MKCESNAWLRWCGWPAWLACAWWLSTWGVSGQASFTNECFVVMCPADRTNAACGGVYEFADPGILVTNQCPMESLPRHSIRCEPPVGTSLEPGEHPVTCMLLVKDVPSGECQFRITVVSIGGPLAFECSSNLVFHVPCGSTNFLTGYPAPRVTNGGLVRCEPPAGEREYPVGRSRVNCVATNLCGVQTGCSFTITVIPGDAEPPSIACGWGQSKTIQCSATCGVVNYPLPEVSGGLLAGCSPPSGRCFPAGWTTVFCRATNDCGAVGECSFQIQVVRDSFHGRPRFPDYKSYKEGKWSLGTFTNQCLSNCVVAEYPLPPIQNGWLEGCNPPPGSCFPVGTNIVSCVATNYCTESGTTFRIIVVQEPPQPAVLRLTRTGSAHALEWDERCAGGCLLQKAENPSGPWILIPEARSGFEVSPAELRQYFRLVIE